MDKCRSCMSNFLRAISIGKYNQGLFNQGELVYSTLIGGILTLALGAAFMTYLAIVFSNIVFTNQYNMLT